MNKLIVIEGLDGSGKATQAKRLAEELARQGHAVRQVSFPDYGSPSSALVKMYLAGEFGDKPSDVNAYAASTFFAVDRYASYMKDWRQDYARGVVIADRYTTSNAIHQCSKLDEEHWDAFLDWLLDLEYDKMGLPRPDLVIYLDVDVQTSLARMRRRQAKNHTSADIHEKDTAYLERCLRTARRAADYFGWIKIQYLKDGMERDVDEKNEEIYRILLRQLGRA